MKIRFKHHRVHRGRMQWMWHVDGKDDEDMKWVGNKRKPYNDDDWESTLAWLKQFVEGL